MRYKLDLRAQPHVILKTPITYNRATDIRTDPHRTPVHSNQRAFSPAATARGQCYDSLGEHWAYI